MTSNHAFPNQYKKYSFPRTTQFMKNVLAFCIPVVSWACACDEKHEAYNDCQITNSPCYPIVSLPHDHNYQIFKILLGDTNFECAMFLQSTEYSLEMIKKVQGEFICESRSINILDMIHDNQICIERVKSAKINLLQRKIDKESALIVLKTLKRQVLKAAYNSSKIDPKNLVLDGYICDVYVKNDEKNGLDMYSARFPNPEGSSQSCGTLAGAIALYVRTENVQYRSLELKEITSFLIDLDNGKKNIEDPVLKKERSNSTSKGALPYDATDADLLIHPDSIDLNTKK